MLFVIHAGLSAGLKTPELALEKDESKELAQAMANVNAFYGKVIDPKVLAWVGLIGVAGKLYGPRVMAIKIRKSMEAADKPRPIQRQPLRTVPTPAPQSAAQAPQNPTPGTRFDPSHNPLS